MYYNVISLLSWFIGVLVGLLFLYNFPNFLFVRNTDSLSTITEELSVINIMTTNLKVCFINVLGAFTFGVFTCIYLCYNGFVFSFLLKLIYVVDLKYYFNLLPHSFEIIGFILSGSVGIELGLFFYFSAFTDKAKVLNYRKILNKSIASIVIIILFSFVEVYISATNYYE